MKTLLFVCILLGTNAYSKQIESEPIEMQEDTNEIETELPPVSVNITIANSTDAQSNNKTLVVQDQEVTKKELKLKKAEEEKKKNQMRGAMSFFIELAKLVRI